MSLSELIAQRSAARAPHVSIADILARTALKEMSKSQCSEERQLITQYFVGALLRDGADGALGFVENLMENGVSHESILRQYIPQAARCLGKFWEDDDLDFAQVTHGSGQLMRLVHELSRMVPVFPLTDPDRPRMLLARPPGETHFLGLLVAASQFRSAGWLVKLDLSGDIGTLDETLRAEEFDVIGVTAGSYQTRAALESMAETIHLLKGKARTVVGGKYVDIETGISDAMGFDLSVGPDENAQKMLREKLNCHA